MHRGDGACFRAGCVVDEAERQVVDATDAGQRAHGVLASVEHGVVRPVRARAGGQAVGGAADTQRRLRARAPANHDPPADGDCEVSRPAVPRVSEKLTRLRQAPGDQVDGIDWLRRQVETPDHRVLPAAADRHLGRVLDTGVDGGDAPEVPERVELRGTQDEIAGRHGDVIETGGLDLAGHRGVHETRHGEGGQAREGQAQRAHGQQGAGPAARQVPPCLAIQRAHEGRPRSPAIRPSRTVTTRDASAARAGSCVT